MTGHAILAKFRPLESIDILKGHGLRNTQTRVAILDVFLAKDLALAQADVEEAMGDHDRVTVYRTIKTFVDKGILHRVMDDEAVPKFALCHDCTEGEHRHEHVHFKCEKCGNTVCLEELTVPKVKLPEGYKYQEANLLVQGICKDCG